MPTEAREGHVDAYMPTEAREEARLPGAGAVGDCEMLCVGAGKQAQVLWEDNVSFNHCAISPDP